MKSGEGELLLAQMGLYQEVEYKTVAVNQSLRTPAMPWLNINNGEDHLTQDPVISRISQ